MWDLVLKEFRVFKKVVIIYMFSAVLLALFFNMVKRGTWSYMWLCTLITLNLTGFLTFVDFQKMGYLLFCSMPVGRTKQVISRYVSTLVILVTLLLFFFYFGEFFNRYLQGIKFKLQPSKMNDESRQIAMIYIFVLSFFTLFFPLLHKMGTASASRQVYTGIIFSFVISIILINELLLKKTDLFAFYTRVGEKNLILAGSSIFIIFFGFSAFASVRLFKNRDL